jgi:hypothetical protein
MTVEPKSNYMRPAIHVVSAAITACLIATAGSSLWAQSLADVARAEEARRRAVKQPSKVYTNKDLPSVPSPPPQPAPVAADGADKDTAKATPAAKDEKAGDAGAKGTPGGPKDAPKDQAYWSGRMKDLQAQLDRDQTFADALQTRINALTADFTARDDPAQRAVIGRDRQKAVDELDRLKKAIQTDKTAIADLQEQARRASVPPGWLR